VNKFIASFGLVLVAGAQSVGATVLEVSVENLQPADGFYFTPNWVGFHDGGFDLFDVGQRASNGLEVLAETGNVNPLSAEFLSNTNADGTVRVDGAVGGGPIAPGSLVSREFDVTNPSSNQYFSFASMIIPSNDGFFGNGDPFSVELFDDLGDFKGDVTIYIFSEHIFDSGTEINTGSGAAGFSLGFDGNGSGPSTDDPIGLVGRHPDLFENLVGLQTAAGTTIGSNGSGFLGAGEAVARITVRTVPEPASLALIAAGGLFGFARRRK